jgi:hypothetical protein
MVKRLAFLLCAVAAPASAQPATMVYQGTLDDSAGAPVTANVSMTFKIFDAATAGAQLWTETVSADVTNGFFSVVLGETTPLQESFFPPGAPNDRYLSVTIGGAELLPRQPLGSAPWALVCGDAQTMGGIAPAAIADITAVNAGTGLLGGGTSGAVTLDVDYSVMGACGDPTNEKVVGIDPGTGLVQCAPDLSLGSSPDITGVSPGFSGTLVGGGFAGDVTLDLAVPVAAFNGGTGLSGSTNPFGSDYLRSDGFGGWFESGLDGNNIMPGTIDFSKWNNASGCAVGQVPQFDGFNWVCASVTTAAMTSSVFTLGLTCGGVTTSNTSLASVSATFPADGFALIISEAEWDAMDVNQYLWCHMFEDAIEVEQWDWDPGDMDSPFPYSDQMQTHHTTRAVSAGPHTYDLQCSQSGGLDPYHCSGQVLVAYYPTGN